MYYYDNLDNGKITQLKLGRYQAIFLSQLEILTRRLFNTPIWTKNKTSIEYQC